MIFTQLAEVFLKKMDRNFFVKKIGPKGDLHGSKVGLFQKMTIWGFDI